MYKVLNSVCGEERKSAGDFLNVTVSYSLARTNHQPLPQSSLMLMRSASVARRDFLAPQAGKICALAPRSLPRFCVVLWPGRSARPASFLISRRRFSSLHFLTGTFLNGGARLYTAKATDALLAERERCGEWWPCQAEVPVGTGTVQRGRECRG